MLPLGRYCAEIAADSLAMMAAAGVLMSTPAAAAPTGEIEAADMPGGTSEFESFDSVS